MRTDGGGEYQALKLLSKDIEIVRQCSEARNRASNGKVERMHRSIMNMVRSMIFAFGLTICFWGDAAEYASYIPNRSSRKAIEGRKTPIKLLAKYAPVLSDIVIFLVTMHGPQECQEQILR